MESCIIVIALSVLAKILREHLSETWELWSSLLLLLTLKDWFIFFQVCLYTILTFPYVHMLSLLVVIIPPAHTGHEYEASAVKLAVLNGYLHKVWPF